PAPLGTLDAAVDRDARDPLLPRSDGQVVADVEELRDREEIDPAVLRPGHGIAAQGAGRRVARRAAAIVGRDAGAQDQAPATPLALCIEQVADALDQAVDLGHALLGGAVLEEGREAL